MKTSKAITAQPDTLYTQALLTGLSSEAPGPHATGGYAAVVLSASGDQRPSATQGAPTITASNLIESFGINTHAGFDNIDAYSNSALIIRCLSYLGIDNVRDSYRSNGVSAQVIAALANAGIKFDFIASNTLGASGSAGIAVFVASISNFAAIHPDSVVAIEGQNEVNVQGTSYGSDSTLSAAVAVQRDLYNDVKSDSIISSVSVYNLTVANDDESVYAQLGDLANISDYANAHVYTGTADNAEQRMAASITLADNASSDHPTVVTEIGLTTDPAAEYLGVDQLAQAKMILTGLLTAFAEGSQKTYIYELLDTPSITASDEEKTFGIFNADGSPKIAAIAMHNFIQTLSSNGGGPVTGSVSVTALQSDAHYLNVQKASGASDLIFWRDVSAWNDAQNTDAIVSPETVTIYFSKVQPIVYMFNPVIESSPIETFNNVSSVEVNISDSPIIIELGDVSSSPMPPAAISASLTVDGVSLVAQIDALAKMSGLDRILLSGSHILQVSSPDTMEDIITNYQALLGKIVGGFEFNIEDTGAGWRTETLYMADGERISTSSYSSDASGAIHLHVEYSSGAVDNYTWAAGVLSAENHISPSGFFSTSVFDNQGRKTLEQEVDKNGIFTSIAFNPVSGAALSKSVQNPDKSGQIYHYLITGQTYTSDHYVLGNGGIVLELSRYHSDGTLDYHESSNIDGGRTLDYYNSMGGRTVSVEMAPDGSEVETGFAETTLASGSIAINLFSYTPLTGNNIAISSPPVVNVMNASGDVLENVSASDYSISNGIFRINPALLAERPDDGKIEYLKIDYLVAGGGSPLLAHFILQVDGSSGSIVGSDKSEIIDKSAWEYAVHVIGSGGNDVISGGSGDDVLEGGAGDDSLEGGAGNDTLDGGDGSDTVSFLRASAGLTVDLHVEGLGNWQDTGSAGTDTLISIENLIGSRFADTIYGDDGANVLMGNDGDDTIYAGDGVNKIYGNAGDDVIHGGSGTELLNGGAGNDTIYVSHGTDTIQGGIGIDTVDYSAAVGGLTLSLALQGSGTGGSAVLPTAQVIYNYADGTGTLHAVVETLSGVENVIGSHYADRVIGDANANLLLGGAGDDTLYGAQGDDTIHGGEGDDQINGGQGNDQIYGDTGYNKLTGGKGADTFHLFYDPATHTNVSTANADRITDFSHADGDKIDLSLISAAVGTITYSGTIFSGVADSLIVVKDPGQAVGNYLVEIDTDGNGIADFVAHVTGQQVGGFAAAPVASDFTGLLNTIQSSHLVDHHADLFG